VHAIDDAVIDLVQVGADQIGQTIERGRLFASFLFQVNNYCQIQGPPFNPARA
jgi:hypothetical protein